MEEIRTPIGIISGTVCILGLPTHGSGADAKVIAERGNETAEVTNHISNSTTPWNYSLVVSPGKWKVRAEVLPVVSESREIEVSDGGSVTVNFVFGRSF
jgi:hypothetical protein